METIEEMKAYLIKEYKESVIRLYKYSLTREYAIQRMFGYKMAIKGCLNEVGFTDEEIENMENNTLKKYKEEEL